MNHLADEPSFKKVLRSLKTCFLVNNNNNNNNNNNHICEKLCHH